jgi:hypothetical protein
VEAGADFPEEEAVAAVAVASVALVADHLEEVVQVVAGNK